MTGNPEPSNAEGGAGFVPELLLKADLFGRVERGHSSGAGPRVTLVRRDTRAARWWLRGLARALAAREARALERLTGLDGLPQLRSWRSGVLLRSWVEGEPMQRARPRDPTYFAAAAALLERVHERGVCHNDLAKEPNWLVRPDGSPALVDFQLARWPRRGGRTSALLQREDRRHLLKHKRSYCPEQLTGAELALLARPSWPARLWRRTGKPVYRFITRGLLGWADREGAGDRGAPPGGGAGPPT